MKGTFATSAVPAWPIELLRSGDIKPTARLLAQTFHDNPCYQFMHPRVAARAADLCAFFVRNLSWREPLRLTWIARGAGREVIGTGTLQPPGSGVSRDVAKLLSHWVWPTLRHQGVHTFTRTLAAERAFSRQQRLAAGQPEYWLVHAVAVRPDMQGRAVGSAIMHKLLDELGARAVAADVPVVLATQREANLTFYARLGFRVRHQLTMGRSILHPGFSSWFMRYEPTAELDTATCGTNS